MRRPSAPKCPAGAGPVAIPVGMETRSTLARGAGGGGPGGVFAVFQAAGSVAGTMEASMEFLPTFNQ